jgi:agmatine deiminase
MVKKNLLFINAFLLFQSCGFAQIITDKKVNNYFTQGNLNRTAAEWEPARGTMVVWPLSVPYKLVVELSKDNHLYTLVANDSTKIEAQKWYNQWGINSNNNTFVYAPQGIDAWWTRDWGPSAVFTNHGEMKLGDGKYIYSTPATKISCNDSLKFLYAGKTNEIIKTEIDDNATIPLAKGLNLEVLDLPYINTGGNVLTDGLGSAFSTCIILNENRFYNVNQDKFLSLNKELLGFDHYNVISNFEKMGIQHIDCFMKLLDEERILVAEPPADHELYPIYENIIKNELRKLKTAYGRPYEILRIKTDRYDGERLAAYTNSIIVNKTIYVPLFQVKADSIALQIWRAVMPGYTVKGFTFALTDEPIVSKEMKEHYKSGYGWDNGDALHCRTRAIWDNEMLFITTKKIDKVVTSKQQNIVYTTIIDYSKKGLVKDKSQIFWRVSGDTNWSVSQLSLDKNQNQFFYEIPYHKKGTTVEYFISAESKSGRKETQPRTAPLGTYQFRTE